MIESGPVHPERCGVLLVADEKNNPTALARVLRRKGFASFTKSSIA